MTNFLTHRSDHFNLPDLFSEWILKALPSLVGPEYDDSERFVSWCRGSGLQPLTALHPSLREPVRTQARTLVRAGQSVYGSDSLVLSVAAVWFRANHVPFLKYMMFNVHLKNYLFIISIFVPLLCLHCLMGFSLVTPSGDSSAAVVPGRLVAEPLLLRSFSFWARALGWAAFSSCLVRAP